MARRRRCCLQGTFQHIISRFLDREFRLTDSTDRDAYLQLLGSVAERSDWRFIVFALMSSHVHLSVLTGKMPLHDILGPLHMRFARRWHKRHGGLGPVLADRPANHRVRPQRFGELVAYNHMDPVRSGLVRRPADSPWTSHRCYLRLDRAPPWLDVEFGLALCGFEDNEAGRKLFDDFVRSTQRRHWQRDITDAYDRVDRADLVDQSHLAGAADSHQNWEDLVAATCKAAGVTVVALQSRSRCRQVVRARWTIARQAHENLGVNPAEIARRLGVGKSAVSYMLATAQRDDAELIAVVRDRVVIQNE